MTQAECLKKAREFLQEAEREKHPARKAGFLKLANDWLARHDEIKTPRRQIRLATSLSIEGRRACFVASVPT